MIWSGESRSGRAILTEFRQNGIRTGRTTVWIRADANEEIASGHLARMLSVAGELQKLGARVRFVLADEESLSWLRKLTGGARPKSSLLQEDAFLPKAAGKEPCKGKTDGCWDDKVSVLGIPYGHPDEELRPLAELAGRECPDWILVDSYAVHAGWFTAVRNALPAGIRLAFLDDERAFDPGTDLVINYDPDAGELAPFYRSCPGKLLGPLYAPLREQFQGLIPCVRPEVEKILISTGGTDPFHLAEDLKALAEESVHKTAVLAPGYPRVEQVAELFLTCDLAISAAGTTLYELCAAGVPTLCFAMADNQVLFARQMEKAGAVTYLGDVREESVKKALPRRVREWILEQKNLRLRQQESAGMHALTDGCGSRRIAEALSDL